MSVDRSPLAHMAITEQLGQMDGGSSKEANNRRMQKEQLSNRFRSVLGQFKQCCDVRIVSVHVTLRVGGHA